MNYANRPSESIEISLNDFMSEAGRKILRFHFQRMVSHEKGTKLGEDIEELHDMRVSSRRIRAALRIFRPFYVKKEIKPFSKKLGKTGRILGVVRDMDVFLEKLSIDIDENPNLISKDLEAFQIYWQNERENFQLDLVTYLNSDFYLDFRRDFKVFTETPFWVARKNRREYLHSRVPGIIKMYFAQVKDFNTEIGAANLEEYHRLRIRLKILRYTLEFFRDVLDPGYEQIIDAIKPMQDHLGDLNDAWVARGYISQFIEKGTSGSKDVSVKIGLDSGIQEYLSFKQNQLEELRQSVPSVWKFYLEDLLEEKISELISKPLLN